MALYHPLLFEAQNDMPDKKDFDIWCGTTFTFKLSLQHPMRDSTDINHYPYTENITTMAKDSANDRKTVYSYSPGVGLDPFPQYSFDRLILNIRKKSLNRSKLNYILWALEFNPYGEVVDDRPRHASEIIHIPLRIDVSITEEMLQDKYEYEIVAITDEAITGGILNANFTPSLFIGKYPEDLNSNDLFPFKKIVMYGDIQTHQVGDIT